MKNFPFEISRERFNPLWLIVGLIIGRAIGLFGGLNLGFWYIADPVKLIWWQIFGAVMTSLFCSFLMTSRASVILKWSLIGMGIGFAVGVYGGEVKSLFQSGQEIRGLKGIDFGAGIFMDWYVQHLAILGLFIGWITSAAVYRKRGLPISKPESKITIRTDETR
ncbi:MAG: hypothetical protein ABIC40_00550 [bacterium]